MFKCFATKISNAKLMFDTLENIKKQITDKVSNFDLYLNICITLVLLAMCYYMTVLVASYINRDANDRAFLMTNILGIVSIVLFYVKNMSRINLFIKSQWVSLDKSQKIILVSIILISIVNIIIRVMRNDAISSKFLNSSNMLILLTGLILSITIARTINSVMNIKDYVKNNKKNQLYNKLNRELSVSKLNSIKASIESDI